MDPAKETPETAGNRYPLLPLRDIVIFPGMIAPLFVGRPKSIKALDMIFKKDKLLILATQKDSSINEPGAGDLYDMGCIAEVTQILRLPDGAVKALIEGKDRAKINKFEDLDDVMMVDVTTIDDEIEEDKDLKALMRTAKSSFERYAKLNHQIPNEVALMLSSMKNPGLFADTIAANLVAMTDEKQKFLEMVDIKLRLEKLVAKIHSEIELLQIERRVRSRVKKQMERSQRDYYLNEQMKAIQKELGKSDSSKSEMDELRGKIAAAGMPKDIEKRALKELGKLEQMPPMSAEGTVSRNYIDWLVEAPWNKRTRDKLSIKGAGKILDEDHYGLSKVKERILEYLSVRKLVKRMKGPVLCFVGPPGVGKTSLGKSIARAMGRKFVRFSLGGIRDEAEIRGHRRTYIGSMPGRIIQSMKKAGVKNPVIMLDEIDKIASDFRGDPASALLEALDPEQNYQFNDHYLEVDYDLSEVMFITTANVLHTIPRPLQDRMEVIHISGYTDDEKEVIARRFLLPKQEKEHGLPEGFIKLAAESLRKVIRNYTRESGVRNLERELANICRKLARKMAETKSKKPQAPKVSINTDDLTNLIGEIKYRDDIAGRQSAQGVVNGLAWTEVGGSLLKVETTIMDGKGKFILTGKLGDVMKESAQAALSYIRSRAKDFGLAKGFHNKIDIHIHIPEGAIPKDGPSAGITLATAMTSALLKIPVRHDVAMTGEITLLGEALPIGGLKEKMLAAKRAGIKIILIPKENERDLKEIPENLQKGLEIITVKNMDDVLAHALVKSPLKKRKSAKKTKRKAPAKRTTPRSAPGPALN
ncbi:ATP-dependent protease La Type I [hydrothermal vent metagenome]|uniref:endopeptidase La n=1 Tax=hydrothermal vent metagenome TaxID=652676 RepID=A0A3B1C2P5_9ZZZZ